MDGLPFLNQASAITTGHRLNWPGPAMSVPAIEELVAGLRAAALASVQPVADVTELAAPADEGMYVVDRATWLERNTVLAFEMLSEANGGLAEPETTWQRCEARVAGGQLGAALALLSSRVLGQYLPLRDQPELILVAPNVAVAQRKLNVEPSDFWLWICLHEQTHRLQFAQAPWLRDYLISKIGALLGTLDYDPPTGRSPAQQTLLAEATAVMALLEGYADVMMDRVGPEVVPTVDEIRQAFNKRRHRGGLNLVVNKLLGLDAKLKQYRDGAIFCQTVMDRVGVSGLNAVYSSVDFLPTPDEIAEPALWVQRVHG